MKKSLIILALAIGGSALAQCQRNSGCSRRNSDSPSTVFATYSGGLGKTMDAELSIKINSFFIGTGAGIMIDNEIQQKDNIVFTRNDYAYFGNLGYQTGNCFIGARIGKQTLVHVTGMVNGVQQSIPDESKLLIGGSVGYSVAPRVRFNIGYDTFNKANLGVTFGL
jgi:hypothetical protein